jgi:hypothetical protein
MWRACGSQCVIIAVWGLLFEPAGDFEGWSACVRVASVPVLGEGGGTTVLMNYRDSATQTADYQGK